MVHSPSAKSLWCTLGSKAQFSPAIPFPAHPLPPSWGEVREVTLSARFHAVSPPSSQAVLPLLSTRGHCSSSGSYSATLAGGTLWPPLVFLFKVVGGHPAFEGLHLIQDLAVPPAIGVPLQYLHGHPLLEACCFLVPLVVRDRDIQVFEVIMDELGLLDGLGAHRGYGNTVPLGGQQG